MLGFSSLVMFLLNARINKNLMQMSVLEMPAVSQNVNISLSSEWIFAFSCKAEDCIVYDRKSKSTAEEQS